MLKRYSTTGLIAVAALAGMLSSMAAFSAPGSAPLTVTDAWARATVEGQSAGGAFMTLTAQQDLDISAVDSGIAKTVQLHEMSMNGNSMTMRAIAVLHLKAGETAKLTPGDRHIMLFGLNQQLKAGEHFTLVLKGKTADGRALETPVDVTVRPLGQ